MRISNSELTEPTLLQVANQRLNSICQWPAETDMKALNKRLQWQKEALQRGLRMIALDLQKLKFFVFVHGSFADNSEVSSQIGYVLMLVNEDQQGEEFVFTICENIVH